MSLKKLAETKVLLQKLQNISPKLTLASICKAFVRSHLDYADILYNHDFNKSLHDRVESI